MKVEYLIAWEDGMWTTETHEVPTKSKENNPRTRSVLQRWADKNLRGQAKYRRAVLFTVYDYPAWCPATE